jgi:hypothetical protein
MEESAMKYNARSNVYTLGSGRSFYANNSIIGIERDCVDVFYGFDGPVEGPLDGPPGFTRAERREIAEEMIMRWKQWGEWSLLKGETDGKVEGTDEAR